MRAWEVSHTFGLGSLVCVERPEPEPGPDEVLIRMRAASLNYRDLMMVEGRYNPKQPLPLIPLSDGVGEVVAVGESVSRVKVGDRVAGSFFQQWISGRPDKAALRSTLGGPLDGMLSELRVLHQEGVVSVPEHLTDEEAATLPCAGVTAWNALVTLGNLQSNDWVVVQGTGGVSMFAMQFALMHGARVVVLSGSDEKLQKTRAVGDAVRINYKLTPDWEQVVLDVTNGRGADHIIEVGGADTLPRSLQAIRFGGQISVIGILSGLETRLNLIPVLMNRARLQGIYVGSRDSFETMNQAIATHSFQPVIGDVFPLEKTFAAFQRMKTAHHFGKIVIRF